jgi:exodeoxyribonuclease VII large subunit
MLTPHRDVLVQARAALRVAMGSALSQLRARLGTSVASLNALSPQSTLDRGYAVVRSSTGTVVRSHDEVAVGAGVTVRLASGSLEARVTDVAPPA